MMPDDNDHLEQNDRQVNLYKLILSNGTTDLIMEPIKVLSLYRGDEFSILQVFVSQKQCFFVKIIGLFRRK